MLNYGERLEHVRAKQLVTSVLLKRGSRVKGEGEGQLNFVLITCVAGTERQQNRERGEKRL